MMARTPHRPASALLPPDILPTGKLSTGTATSGGHAESAALRDQAAAWRRLAGGFDPRAVRTAIEKAADLERAAARLERTRNGR